MTVTLVDRPVKHIPGEAGIWVFLFGDLVIFVVLFVAYLVDRAVDPNLFSASSQELGFTVGVVNTLVLLTSSLFVLGGVQAVRHRETRLAVWAFVAAIACGVAFVVLKVTEYAHLAALDHGPDANAFFGWYFILTGVHLLHVLIGLGLLCLMISKARTSEEDGSKGLAIVEGGACFWHLVDLLWMLIFPLLYLVA